ncbi:hypothetical protein MMC12_006471 [Toensbergia leucococca]|nr:hypothetical protein [Toensbergia leucococca]
MGQDENHIDPRKPSKASPPPRHHGRFTKSFRPSKFIEGSMKDRTSMRPPKVYTGEQDEQITAGLPTSRPRHHKRHSFDDGGKFYDAGIDTSKPSGMYRFGKAIANVFNGIWKEKDEHTIPAQTIFQERQVKAEKAYAELKKTGFKGMQGASVLRSSEDIPAVKYEDVNSDAQPALHRDSGIDVDGYRSSSERKRDGLIFDTDEALVPPPAITGFGHSTSPTSEASSGNRSSLRLRKTSFHSLKSVRSHLQLPSTKRKSTQLEPASPAGSNTPNGQLLRSEPSSKDLAKQQKLSKKVSDLENKLEVARRDLRLVMGDRSSNSTYPIKIRAKPFQPGALPSLPSESILNGRNSSVLRDKNSKAQTSPDKMFQAVVENLVATNVSHSIDQIYSSNVETATDSQLKQELIASTDAKKFKSKKRKSAHESRDDTMNFKPTSDDDDDAEWDAATKTTPKKKAGKVRKSQKTEKDDSPSQDAKDNSKPEKLTSKGNNGTTSKNTKHEASTPAMASVFDSSKIDQAKILSMRSKANPEIPFGELSDDFVNIRKTYPSMTHHQVVTYLSTLEPINNKPSHQNSSSDPAQLPSKYLTRFHSASPSIHQPPSNSLTRPHSTSPSKRLPKPPLHSVSSSRSPHHTTTDPKHKEALPADDVVTVSPSKDSNIPPMPKVPQSLEADVAKVDVEFVKAMRKEEWEWPEDVF